MLTSLARVLRLDDDQRAYMNELAGTPAKSRRRAPQKVKPYLRRVLERIDAPAILMTPTHDILAWNPLAAALMVDFGELAERDRNCMRLLFTDLRTRSLYPEWKELARSVVCYICMEAARKPDDSRLAELVGDLSIRDAQFRQWWAGTHVAAKRRGTRRYSHPIVGEITLEWDSLTSDAEPDQLHRRARIAFRAIHAGSRVVERDSALPADPEAPSRACRTDYCDSSTTLRRVATLLSGEHD